MPERGMNRVPGIALTGFAAVFALLALTPAGASFVPNEGGGPAGYAMAEVVHRDVGGELVSSHTVHNRLVDTGEALMIQGTFGTIADNEKPTVMCVHALAASDVLNTRTADTFTATLLSTANSLFANAGQPTCVDANIDITTDSSLAALYATFEGTTNLDAGAEIGTIVICNTVNSATSRTHCLASGDLFSIISIPLTTVGANDTLSIEYIFDLTSPRD
ncbi:hypothetical protein CENSYa_1520 [Cenarchaeum symbiosum A]|uniref:Uncharacterized protein n=1 Tax=Cenarchaeum symbiosum (strain A) TaxID=414004 RepID=A0RXS5_CENSY|nr:hypothetical protein CENSYa_1520 [Cenarchaeum symbiosum A]